MPNPHYSLEKPDGLHSVSEVYISNQRDFCQDPKSVLEGIKRLSKDQVWRYGFQAD